MRRLFEFAKIFKANGHEVTVLTAMPNYPDGIVPEKYKGRFFYHEMMEGVSVYRSWALPAANSQPRKRMIGFLTFFVTSLFNSFRIKEGFDIVLSSTPPVTTPIIGMTLSALYRKKHIVEIRDLQPESSEEFGNLKPSLFTKSIKKIMHFMYRRADYVVAVTEGIQTYLLGLGIPKERISAIRSGVGSDFLQGHSDGIRKRFSWEGKFLVLYSGTLGWAHSLETVIEAAKILKDDPDVYFAFVGDGHLRESLEGLRDKYDLKNVEFCGSQPLEQFPFFLRASDVLIESLRETPVTRGTFPCKLFEYMASGRPIVFGSSGGEATNELEKAGGALSFSGRDSTKLAGLIRELKSGRIDGGKLGKSYHDYADRNFRREQLAEEYLEILDQL